MKRIVTTVVLVISLLGFAIIISSMLTENLTCYPFNTAIQGSDGTNTQYTIDASCQMHIVTNPPQTG
jgi:hypothetical protein